MTAIALATCTEEATLFHDEAPLVDALEAKGATVYPVVWNSPEIDWSSYDLVVIRNTWDYHRQISAFRAWLDYLEQHHIAVLNPLPLLRWNIDKQYLDQLAEQGITTLPTVFAKGKDTNLLEVLRQHQWQSAVVKPIISGSGDHTWVITEANAQESQRQFDWLNDQIGMMIQPLASQIQDNGEISLVFFAGEYSHAVCKKPAPDHLLVQEEFGGSIDLIQPDKRVIQQGLNIVKKVTDITGFQPIYARVDGFLDDDTFVLMEFECIEPELYFTRVSHAAERFASLILDVATAS